MARFDKRLFVYFLLLFALLQVIILIAVKMPKITIRESIWYSIFEKQFEEYLSRGNISDQMKDYIFWGWMEQDLNVYASDLLGNNRVQPEIDDWCKEEGRFLDNLPKTSIIIYSRNEVISVLRRAITSILKQTPSNLIHEIILVDDFSKMKVLEEVLGADIADRVTIMRTTKFEGSVRARLLASEQATGEILTFVDSRCECFEGWLQPLLDRIAADRTRVVSPILDMIKRDTLDVHQYSSHFVGGFDWDLSFQWLPESEEEQQRHMEFAEPYKTPAILGVVFSIDKYFFERLRIFNRNFHEGNHLELSLKTWMCGGSLEIVPCSHVGYVFKGMFAQNEMAVTEEYYGDYAAKGWLDEYAKHYFYRRGINMSSSLDVSEIKDLRHKLKCKSFKWYLDNVFPELLITANALAYSQIKIDEHCLDSKDPQLIKATLCDSSDAQFWVVTTDEEIRQHETCLEYSDDKLKISPCHGLKGNQRWRYEHMSQRLQLGGTSKCLTINERDVVILEDCGKVQMQWNLRQFEPKLYSIMYKSENAFPKLRLH